MLFVTVSLGRSKDATTRNSWQFDLLLSTTATAIENNGSLFVVGLLKKVEISSKFLVFEHVPIMNGLIRARYHMPRRA